MTNESGIFRSTARGLCIQPAAPSPVRQDAADEFHHHKNEAQAQGHGQLPLHLWRSTATTEGTGRLSVGAEEHGSVHCKHQDLLRVGELIPPFSGRGVNLAALFARSLLGMCGGMSLFVG